MRRMAGLSISQETWTAQFTIVWLDERLHSTELLADPKVLFSPVDHQLLRLLEDQKYAEAMRNALDKAGLEVDERDPAFKFYVERAEELQEYYGIIQCRYTEKPKAVAGDPDEGLPERGMWEVELWDYEKGHWTTWTRDKDFIQGPMDDLIDLRAGRMGERYMGIRMTWMKPRYEDYQDTED